MSFAAEGTAILNRIMTQWAGATPISWPNVNFTPAAGQSHVRVTIRNGTSLQPYIGKHSKRRSVGVVFGEVMVPENTGDGSARGLADDFAALFRDVRVSGITFGEPSARQSTLQEKPWFRWLVEVPYYRDWSPQGVDEMASYPQLYVSQVAHGFSLGDWLNADGGVWSEAQADDAATLSYPAVVTHVESANRFAVTLPGGKANLPSHGFGAAGAKVWLSQATAGLGTATEPTTGLAQQVARVWDADHLIVVALPTINKG